MHQNIGAILSSAQSVAAEKFYFVGPKINIFCTDSKSISKCFHNCNFIGGLIFDQRLHERGTNAVDVADVN